MSIIKHGNCSKGLNCPDAGKHAASWDHILSLKKGKSTTEEGVSLEDVDSN